MTVRLDVDTQVIKGDYRPSSPHFIEIRPANGNNYARIPTLNTREKVAAFFIGFLACIIPPLIPFAILYFKDIKILKIEGNGWFLAKSSIERSYLSYDDLTITKRGLFISVSPRTDKTQVTYGHGGYLETTTSFDIE